MRSRDYPPPRSWRLLSGAEKQRRLRELRRQHRLQVERDALALRQFVQQG